jgi:hypothetical protein
VNCKAKLLYVCEKRTQVKRAIRYKNWEYYVSRESRNWLDSEKICITWGGHLASINSSRENSVIVMALARNIPHYWIGFKQIKN